MTTYDYDEIKAAEKQKLKEAEAELDTVMLKAKELNYDKEWVEEKEGKTAAFNIDTTQVLAGVALIVIGIVALTTQTEIWNFWWLIFLFKPLFFGWGKKRHHWK